MFKKHKQLIIGFVLGALLFSIIPVSATVQEYIFKKSNDRLMVDGKEIVNEKLPMLKRGGYNYIPVATFREICDKIGVGFEWVGEAHEIRIDTSKDSTKDGKRVNDMINNAQKGEYNLLVIDEIEYVLLRDIWQKYNNKYNFNVAPDSSATNRAIIVQDKATAETLYNIPHEQVYIFNHRTYLTYEYFKSTILPIVEMEGD